MTEEAGKVKARLDGVEIVASPQSPRSRSKPEDEVRTPGPVSTRTGRGSSW